MRWIKIQKQHELGIGKRRRRSEFGLVCLLITGVSACAGLQGAGAGALLKKKKTKPSLLEKIRPLTSGKQQPPLAPNSETIRCALLWVRLRWPSAQRRGRSYTLMSAFTDIKQEHLRPPHDPSAPPCLLSSSFYLRLIRADRSANIDLGCTW